MTIDATAGGANSDSFATIAEANAYHNARLHNETWFDANTDTKERALKWATRILDDMKWKGSKTASTQALEWPRAAVLNLNGDELDDATIPTFLINAVSEYAFELIKMDREVDSDTKGISQVMAGEVSVKFDKTDRPSKTPTSIYRIIKNYLASGNTGAFQNIERA